MLLKLLVQVFADADVLEHALQLGGVLKATRLLQGKGTVKKKKKNALAIEKGTRGADISIV